MTFREDAVPAFLEIFERSKNLIRNFEGCQHLELLKDKNNPNILFTYSKWEDPSFLEKYRKSELFANTWKDTKALFKEKAEAWSVEQLTII